MVDERTFRPPEFWPVEEARRRQDELVRRHVGYAARHSPFYRELFRVHGVKAGDIRGAADLARLPFTDKKDTEERNLEFLAVPMGRVVDMCLTSGTTGRPVAMLQTKKDLDRLARNEQLSFIGAGISPADRVLICAAADRCFMAGLAYFMGLVKLGATAIRGGSSSVPMLAEMFKRLRPTAVVGVPTLMLAVAGHLSENGAEPGELGIRKLVCIGEPVRREDLGLSPLGSRLRQIWAADVYSTYASTEMATTFCDCVAGAGGHLHPDLMAVEIVSESGLPAGPGECGEVVATPLGVSGMPLIRFRTGDIAALHHGRCACGRTSPRLGPVVGRKAQMLKIKGTTVYPPAIFAALAEVETVVGYYIEVTDEFDLSDRVRVTAASSDPALRPEVLAERIAARIRVKPEVVMATPEEVQRKVIQEGKRKPVTFFDYRGRKSES